MKILPILLLALLSACASPAPPSLTSSSVVSRPAAGGGGDVAAQLARLPGAQRQGVEPLRFSYPGATLFGPDAVLPLPGGPLLLDPLADLLKQHPQLRWDVVVRAETRQGSAYDQFLAEKRSEVLASYLLSRGVDLGKLNFLPAAAPGAPLELTLQPPAAAN